MNRLVKLVIFLNIKSVLLNYRVIVIANETSSVAQSFARQQVVPDVIPKAPPALLHVTFPSGAIAKLGNELTPTEVKDEPKVAWEADANKFYTLAMIDPDTPSRTVPASREFQHWLVGNIPGNNVYGGETLTAYLGAAPIMELHRYVLLVYPQEKKLYFDEARLSSHSLPDFLARKGFSIASFAKKYNMGKPIAGNFFLAKFDTYVPFIYKQQVQTV